MLNNIELSNQKNDENISDHDENNLSLDVMPSPSPMNVMPSPSSIYVIPNIHSKELELNFDNHHTLPKDVVKKSKIDIQPSFSLKFAKKLGLDVSFELNAHRVLCDCINSVYLSSGNTRKEEALLKLNKLKDNLDKIINYQIHNRIWSVFIVLTQLLSNSLDIASTSLTGYVTFQSQDSSISASNSTISANANNLAQIKFTSFMISLILSIVNKFPIILIPVKNIILGQRFDKKAKTFIFLYTKNIPKDYDKLSSDEIISRVADMDIDNFNFDEELSNKENEEDILTNEKSQNENKRASETTIVLKVEGLDQDKQDNDNPSILIGTKVIHSRTNSNNSTKSPIGSYKDRSNIENYESFETVL